MKKTKTKNEKHWEETARKWRDYANRLKSQRNNAFDRLKNLSVGMVPSDIYSNSSWSHETKMQYSAASFLKEQAAQSNTEPEWFYP